MYSNDTMRRFGIGVAGLALLTTAATAAETNLSPQTLRITSGRTVATVDFPAQSSTQGQPVFKSDRIRSTDEELVFTGHAHIQIGDAGRQVLIVTADSVTMDIPGHKLKSLTCNGRVVVQVREAGRQKLQ